MRQVAITVMTIVVGAVAYWWLGVKEWQNIFWAGLIAAGVMIVFLLFDLWLNWERIDWTKIK